MLAVGKILKAHGIRGDVKAESYMDTPASFSEIKKLFVDGEELVVERAKVAGNFVLIKFKGVDTMNDAELLRGKLLSAEKTDLPDPGQNRYYIGDLLGSKVCDEEGCFIGTLKDVLQYGSADVYLLENGKGTVMFPFVGDVVKEISVKEQIITVCKSEFEKVAVYED